MHFYKTNYLRCACLIAVLALLLFSAVPADAQLADVANDSTSVSIEGNKVIVTSVLAFSASDSTNDLTSKAIDMTGLTAEGGVIEFVADGETGRDVNLFVRGGHTTTLANIVSYYTRPEWDDFSADDANTTALFDTKVSVDANTLKSTFPDSVQMFRFLDPAFKCRYVVFEADGQTGNTVASGTNSTTIRLTLFKDPNYKLPIYESAILVSTE